MNRYLEGFIEFQKGYGLAETTLTRNRYILNIFFRWLGDMDIKDVTRQKIASYRAYLKNYTSNITGRKLAKRTIKHYVDIVKCLFDYLIRYEMILSNPAEGLKIKEDKIQFLRSIFTIEDINIFLDSIKPDTFKGIRDKAIFELMYSSGLRASDVIRLEIEHLNIEQRILLVRGKGNKDRYIPFSETAKKHLIDYLNNSRNMFLKRLRNPSDRRFAFLSILYKLQYRQLKIIFNRYLKKCGLTGKGYTLHSIRHATGTHLLKNGASIRYVQELLGHEDLKSTQLYTHPTIDNIKAVYRTFHPRENEYYRDVDDKYLDEVKKLKEEIIINTERRKYYKKFGTTIGFNSPSH
jgi:integrase/recombinase XerD